jgi:hypothetical protein
MRKSASQAGQILRKDACSKDELLSDVRELVAASVGSDA